MSLKWWPAQPEDGWITRSAQSKMAQERDDAVADVRSAVVGSAATGPEQVARRIGKIQGKAHRDIARSAYRGVAMPLVDLWSVAVPSKVAMP